VVLVGVHFIIEPKLNFCFGRFDSIRAVANVSTNIDAKITADGTRLRVSWLSGSKHLSACFDSIIAFPNHGTNWTRAHVLDKTSKETLLGEISVMFLHVLFAGTAKFHGDKLKAFLLESLDDLTDKTTLHSIRLDHDEGALFAHELFDIHFSVPLCLDVLNGLGVVLEFTLDFKEVSELLNAVLRVIIVHDDGAVRFIGLVCF